MPSVRQIDKPLVATDGTVTIDRWVIIAFLWPLTRLIQFNIGGNVFGQDILAVGFLAILAASNPRSLDFSAIRIPLLFLGLWLFGQVISDLIRETVSEDFIRGWMKITLFGVQICALWLFVGRKPSYIAAFAAGQSIALMMSYLYLSDEYAAVKWKFGLGEGVGLLTAVVFSGIIPGTQRLRPIAGAALIGIALLLLFKGARSAFLEFLVAGSICLLIAALAAKPHYRRAFNKRGMATLLLAGVMVGQGVEAGYSHLAQSGALGEDARIKYEIQSSGDVSILLGGRMESLISTRAIADSPIIGHGSWAKDFYYVRMYAALRKEVGLEDRYDASRQPLIPTHSYLLGAWVEAGILGGIFWILIYAFLLKSIYFLIKYNFPATPIIASCLSMSAWSILFSPFGGEVRFIAAFSVVLIMTVILHGSRKEFSPRL